MPFPPIPVIDIRDTWDTWDWVIVWCTAGAAVLALTAIFVALIAIRRSDATARMEEAARVLERRNVFELGVLTRLIEVCGLNQPGSIQIVQGLLRALPGDELPGIRAEAEAGRVPSNTQLNEFIPEFNAAVDRRLTDGRGPTRG